MHSQLHLSVIMPNHNHGRYLKERLKTVIQELPEKSELVFIDDASTDQSHSIALDFAKSDPRMRFYYNERNMGTEEAFSLGFAKAKGHYIAPMGVDDVILPGHLTKTLEALLENPTIPLACSDNGYFFGNPKEYQSECTLKGAKERTVLQPKEVVLEIARKSFYIARHTVIVKKELLGRFGSYQKKFKKFSDWFVNYAIAFDGGIVYLPDTLALWRLSEPLNNNGAVPLLPIKERKQIFLGILDFLQQPKFASVRSSFRQSDLFQEDLESYFLNLLFPYPRHVDFLFKMLQTKTQRALDSSWGTLKKRLKLQAM